MKRHGKTIAIPLTLALFTATGSVHAIDLDSAMDSADSLTESFSQHSADAENLFDTLSSNLDISRSQATGGTAALMALAQDKLPSDSASMLSSLIPGTGGDLTSQLLGNISSMEGVQSAFSKLGMDPGMISQFTPVLMGYLKENGGEQLLPALKKIWS